MDKVQKIREEVERIQLYTQSKVLKQVLDYIVDEVQKEPVKIKKGCKYRCLSDMINKDTGNISFIGGKIYLAPEDNTLVTEENGWRCDTSENTSNFELVEEPQVKESAKAQHVNATCKNNGNSLTQEDTSDELRTMSSNLYDSLPQDLREVLDQMGESEVAKQIDAELAKEQAQAYIEKINAKEAVENLKNEYTKVKQREEYGKD